MGKYMNRINLQNKTYQYSKTKIPAIQPFNGDPYIGMLETPVTSSPIVVRYLSNLPIYRTGISPLLRGTEIGLSHGFFIPGPFIKLGPLRNTTGVAETAGCISAAALVLLLAVCLTIYGVTTIIDKVKSNQN